MPKKKVLNEVKVEKEEILEGKIVDFIDGRLRTDNDIERIRQDFERTLIEEYRYDREDIGVDVRVKIHDGSRLVNKKASLVIYRPGSEKKNDEFIYIVIQIAKPSSQPSDSSNGAGDLERILIECSNAEFGCWTNGIETIYFQKKRKRNAALFLKLHPSQKFKLP